MKSKTKANRPALTRRYFVCGMTLIVKGAHADFDVNLGGNILRSFNLTMDYPQRRLIFEPNSHAHDSFLSDASGSSLKAEGPDYKKFVVRAVVPNSPAPEAGI